MVRAIIRAISLTATCSTPRWYRTVNMADMKMRIGNEAKASTNPSANCSPIATGLASTPKTNWDPALVNSRNRVATVARAANSS